MIFLLVRIFTNNKEIPVFCCASTARGGRYCSEASSSPANLCRPKRQNGGIYIVLGGKETD